MNIQNLTGRNGGKPNSNEIKVVKFLCREVCRVSGVDKIRLDDHFVSLGLNSIQKRDICVNAEMAFGADVSPEELRTSDTVGELAQHLINNLY